MGGLLFGYDWVVIGGAKPFYEPLLRHSDAAWVQGWAMSSAPWSAASSARWSRGMLSDRFGRKRLLIRPAFCSRFRRSVRPWSPTFTRFVILPAGVGGVAIGLASNLSPMYIAEISPAELRGRSCPSTN